MVPRQPQSFGIHRKPEGIGVQPPLGGEVRRELLESADGLATLFLVSTACTRFGATAALWNKLFPRRSFLRRFLAKDASVLA